MKHSLILFALLMTLCVSCAKTSEHSEEAKQRGIKAAQELIKTNRSSEMAMQDAILNAKSIKSEYILKGDTLAANDFEVAYATHIKEHGDSLASMID